MKNTVIAAATAIVASALASTAQAADIAPAGYDWTGFYIGANAGIAWNNSEVSNKTYDSTTGDLIPEFNSRISGDDTAFTAGGLLGYNYQIDKVVLGVETDFNYLGFDDSTSNSFNYRSLFDATTRSDLEANWFGTIRGRLGFALDNLLIYGTGGAAYGQVDAGGKVTTTIPQVGTGVIRGSSDDVKWGWTVGGGAEYGIDNWSLGLEYLYVDLGSDSWSKTVGEARLKGDADFAFSTVRATVKYRFQ